MSLLTLHAQASQVGRDMAEPEDGLAPLPGGHGVHTCCCCSFHSPDVDDADDWHLEESHWLWLPESGWVHVGAQWVNTTHGSVQELLHPRPGAPDPTDQVWVWSAAHWEFQFNEWHWVDAEWFTPWPRAPTVANPPEPEPSEPHSDEPQSDEHFSEPSSEHDQPTKRLRVVDNDSDSDPIDSSTSSSSTSHAYSD